MTVIGTIVIDEEVRQLIGATNHCDIFNIGEICDVTWNGDILFRIISHESPLTHRKHQTRDIEWSVLHSKIKYKEGL